MVFFCTVYKLKKFYPGDFYLSRSYTGGCEEYYCHTLSRCIISNLNPKCLLSDILARELKM